MPSESCNPVGGVGIGDTFLMSAEEMLIQGGNPKGGGAGGWRYRAWLLDAVAAEGVVGAMAVPRGVAKFRIDAVWVATTADPGAIRFRVGVFTPRLGSSILDASTPVVLATGTAAGTDNIVVTDLGTYAVNEYAPILNINVLRLATDAADTYPADAALLGVRLTVVETTDSFQAPRKLLLPQNVRVIGTNLTCGPHHGGWENLWKVWDWDAWMKPQIDDAVALGSNCVRIFGNVSGVIKDVFSIDTYLARYRQVLDYTASLGIYAYPCVGELEGPGTFNPELVKEIYRRVGALIRDYSHVIGIDGANEVALEPKVVQWPSRMEWLAAVSELGDILRKASGKPVAWSRVVALHAQWGEPRGQWLDAISDFIDVHGYLEIVVPEAVPVIFDTPWGKGKEFILGEFGGSQQNTAAERTARYMSAKALVQSDPRVRGALQWATYDTYTGPNDKWGLRPGPGQPLRTEVTDVFTTFPSRSPFTG